MLTDDFKATIRAHWRDFYPPDKHGGIICPLCGNGSGTSGTGISVDKSSKRANALHCMKCGFSGDIFNLIALDKHWDNNTQFPRIAKFAADTLNLEINQSEIAAINAAAAHAPKDDLVDFSDTYRIAADNLEQTDYWAKRGLSLDTCRHFNCGFLPRWRSPKVKKPIPCSPRFIVPIWQYGYLARDIRNVEDIPDARSRRYIKQKTGAVVIFHSSAIAESDILFAVEGEIDAMSIYEAGFHNVCALGSISMVRKFLSTVKQATKKPRAIIVALDNESAEPVKKAREQLERGLSKMGIACLDGTSVSGDMKDANDLLIANRQSLIDNCKRLMSEAAAIKPSPPVEISLSEESPKTTRQAIADCPVDLLIPHGFIFNARGVMTEKYQPACLTPILPVRVIADAKTGLEKIELILREARGNWRTITTDMSNIADSSALVKLSNLGIETFTGASKYLTQFLVLTRAFNRERIPRVIEYDQPGWTPDRKEFILPYCSEQSLGAVGERFGQKGDFDEWLELARGIRKMPCKLARVMLAGGFTAPLLRPLGSRTFGIFVFGTSGYGKSAAMRFAVSIWGDPNKMAATFNSTNNSYARLAAYCNDLPMLIDEKQATTIGDGTKFATIMYQLATETDRGRMKRDTSLREMNHWRTLIMANGESRLYSESTTSGASNRVIEIGLRDGDRLFASESEAAMIHRFVDDNYGYAGEKYIKAILRKIECGDESEIGGISRAALERLKKERGASEYAYEHLTHVAKLISGDALSGEILFGLSAREAYEDAYKSISEELLPRLPKKSELDDARRAWAHLTHQILTHWTSFIIKGGSVSSDETKYVREIMGRVEMKKVEDASDDEEKYVPERVLIFPETVANILRAAKFDAKKCMTDFVDRGWTPKAKDGGYPRKKWFGKQQRMIEIDADKLFGEIG